MSKRNRKKVYTKRRKILLSLLFTVVCLSSIFILISIANAGKTKSSQDVVKQVYSDKKNEIQESQVNSTVEAESASNDAPKDNPNTNNDSIKTSDNTNVQGNGVSNQSVQAEYNKDKNSQAVTNSSSSKELLDVNSLYKKDGIKTAYLTFDDGPSKTVTPKILETLKKNNVTATFFIIGKMAEESPELVKKEFNEGYSIGYHSYSHNYSKMYGSLNDFENDFNHDDAIMKSILGSNFSSRIYRFPGGAFQNPKYVPYENFLKEKGYTYIDWNALNGDAESPGKKTPQQLFTRFKNTVESGYKEDLIVLMHDTYTKESTAEILPSIIEYLKNKGYEFRQIR
ncbi:polysaccharide deacetylase [Clostridium sp. 19966]|uniref:polysaccharide deacetylase family protein n=1 Tax=Clostridium sp. 19966 TaxID=2768166 RepID=UPI0028DF895E|nr:polysaccharide deacetylase family protein [Clostridium sp. 19966]MDT8716289.1 polysaccharide deacetylase [Clostridium sp. 19966]